MVVDGELELGYREGLTYTGAWPLVKAPRSPPVPGPGSVTNCRYCPAPSPGPASDTATPPR